MPSFEYDPWKYLLTLNKKYISIIEQIRPADSGCTQTSRALEPGMILNPPAPDANCSGLYRGPITLRAPKTRSLEVCTGAHPSSAGLLEVGTGASPRAPQTRQREFGNGAQPSSVRDQSSFLEVGTGGPPLERQRSDCLR